MNYPILEIRFRKSKSANMKEADQLAYKLGSKQIESTYYIEIVDIRDVFRHWEYINSLLNIIGKWKGFEIYYRGFICTTYKQYRKLFYAIQDIKQCYFNALESSDFYGSCYYHKFCCSSLVLDCGFKTWINYGYTNDYKVWHIDKKKILHELTADAGRKKLEACPAFNLKKVIEAVNKFPDQIIIDENWELLYSVEIERGRTVKRATGIQPNFVFDKMYENTEIKDIPLFEMINHRFLSFNEKKEITKNKLTNDFIINKYREN